MLHIQTKKQRYLCNRKRQPTVREWIPHVHPRRRRKVKRRHRFLHRPCDNQAVILMIRVTQITRFDRS